MSSKSRSLSGAVLALLCLAAPAWQAVAAEPAANAHFSAPPATPIAPSAATLSLRAALALALQNNPELNAFEQESQARAAEITQAARWLHPELSVEVANVAGSGSYRGFDAAETTVQLSQQLELGGKRALRRQVAAAEHAHSINDLTNARIDLQTRTAKDFLALLGAQERLKLADEELALAEQTLTVVEEKIAAGKAPAVERYRFQSAVAEARLMKEKAVISRTTARQILADHLGLAAAVLGDVSGDLTALPPLPAYSEIEAQIGQSPEILRRRLESEARRRALALEEANRLVDPTLAVGLRNFNDSDDTALTFGLSLPLPLFNSNQGNLQAAGHRLAAAQAQEANSLRQSRTALAGSWQSLAASRREAQALREEIIPAAQQTFESTRYGYQSGKFPVLEMLEAQRSLMEVRARYFDVLTAAHLAAVELEQLLGRAPDSTTIDPFTKE